MYDEIEKEIADLRETIEYLQKNPNIAANTIMRETPEYCRGALAMIDYLEHWLELHK